MLTKCPFCSGRGKREGVCVTMHGHAIYSEKCKDCFGTGIKITGATRG